MTDDRLDGVITGAIDRWGPLEVDWNGVLDGTAPVLPVTLSGVDSP
ncbi:hypothetical protein OB955_08520 [Halobacteria archaeon AArc-m2/3/4]|uniref:Uncharacterized protein n=1 Tax=Natronoglomus mannanivorans TaxID=2979990 RepID=A0ABT2QCX9_9EURY|nr:hypothetical protein [Halobacteria archaeon AArc-m2/3/4]